MKKIFLSLLFISLWQNQASAWTFVGNGGNAGDIELQAAINQLHETVKMIIKDKNDPDLKLCTCYPKYEGRQMCNTLKQLTPPQVRECAQFIAEAAPRLDELLSQRDQIRFSWTHQSIDVRENGTLRGSDAVTNPTDQSITINQKRFLELDPAERLFLLSHEVFHLTKKDASYLKDEGSAGSFTGPSGGRNFINAMATAIQMEAHDYGTMNNSMALLSRSQAIKKFWLSLGAQQLDLKGEETSAFTVDKTSGAQFSFRYQWSDWGVLGEYSHLSNKKDILTTIKGEETRDLVAVGVAYRWFPFENPMTFWGQSHLLLMLKAERLTAQYKLNDSTTGTDDKAVSNAWSLGGNYFIPLQYDLWIYAGLGYSAHRYSFEKLNTLGAKANYASNNTSAALGVSYAF